MSAIGSPRTSSAQIVAQQEAIAQIGQSALSHELLGELLVEASALVGRVLGTDLVSVLELLPDGSGLKVVTGLGWRPGIVGELVLGTGTASQAGFTLATGSAVVVADLSTEDRFRVSPVLVEHSMTSSMSVRIGEPDKPYGALAAFSDRAGRFANEDVNFLQSVANVLAAAAVRFRAEADTRASLDQLAAIVSTIDEGITVVTRNGLSFANDAAARLTGIRERRRVAQCLRLGAGALRPLRRRRDADVRRGLCRDGVPLPARRTLRPWSDSGSMRRETCAGRIVRAAAVHDADGEITHVINTFREINR